MIRSPANQMLIPELQLYIHLDVLLLALANITRNKLDVYKIFHNSNFNIELAYTTS